MIVQSLSGIRKREPTRSSTNVAVGFPDTLASVSEPVAVIREIVTTVRQFAPASVIFHGNRVHQAVPERLRQKADVGHRRSSA